MSIPYLPGWYDMLDKDALSRAMTNIGNTFAPDTMGSQRLQALLQQNPMMVSQLSNMDPSQRQAVASALGFKNYDRSGLGKIEEGPELQARQELQGYLKNLSPDQRNLRAAKMTDTDTQENINNNRTIFDLGKREKEQGLDIGEQSKVMNDQKIQLQALELDEANQFKTLQDTLKVKYPTENIDLQQVLKTALTGQGDTQLLQRVMSDKTLAPGFKLLYDAYMDRLKLQAQMSVASLKGPEEKFYGIRFLGQAVDDAQAKINSALAIIKEGGVLGKMNSLAPDKQAEYNQALKDLANAQKDHARYTVAFNRAMKESFSGKYPDAFKEDVISTDGPINPKIQQALNMLRSGSGTIEQLQASPNFTEQEKQFIISKVKGGSQ